MARSTRQSGPFDPGAVKGLQIGGSAPRPVMKPGSMPGPGTPHGTTKQPDVSTPDFAIQITDIRPGNPPCFSVGDQAMLVAAVTDSLKAPGLHEFFPNPDVRSTCWEDKAFTIAIWARQPAGTDDAAARDRGAQSLALLDNKFWAVFINASFIRDMAERQFENAPHRYTEDGTPDDWGAVHLTGISVDFVPSKSQVVTSITGYDTTPWPDVHFTMKIIDTLEACVGLLQCPSTTKREIDKGDEALAIALGILAALTLPILAPLGGFVLAGDMEALGGVSSADLGGGAGCMALSVVPPDAPLPDHKKVVFLYDQPEVDSWGIVCRAVYYEAAREPALAIAGPTKLFAYTDEGHTFGTYYAVASDARGTYTAGTLTFQWSSSGGEVFSPGNAATNIRFPTGDAKAGQTLQASVTLGGTDLDGAIPPAECLVEIEVVERNGPPVPPTQKYPRALGPRSRLR